MPALSDGNGLASYCHLTWFGSYERFLRPVMADVMAERDAFGLAEDLGPYFELFVSFFCSGLLALYRQWASSDSELPMEELATLAGSAVAGESLQLRARRRALAPD